LNQLRGYSALLRTKGKAPATGPHGRQVSDFDFP